MTVDALIPNAAIKTQDGRTTSILRAALARIPDDVTPIGTLREVRSMKRGPPGFAGLTTYSKGRQTITFYTRTLELLSRRASLAVVVHELAHAWLNEHRRPEQSKAREEEADALVARWGFQVELDALEDETEPI